MAAIGWAEFGHRPITWCYWGLTRRGYHDLAFEIAHNHVENVAAVFEKTVTLWKNYAPEYSQPGKPAGKDFVGWTGISAINIPIEYLIGLDRPTEKPI